MAPPTITGAIDPVVVFSNSEFTSLRAIKRVFELVMLNYSMSKHNAEEVVSHLDSDDIDFAKITAQLAELKEFVDGSENVEEIREKLAAFVELVDEEIYEEEEKDEDLEGEEFEEEGGEEEIAESKDKAKKMKELAKKKMAQKCKDGKANCESKAARIVAKLIEA